MTEAIRESQIGAVDIFGPTLKFRTALPDLADDYCMMEGTVKPGDVIPLHSHPERETFYIITGKLNALKDGVWQRLESGDIFDIPSNVRHGFRNTSDATVFALVVTSTRLARFMRRAGRPILDETPLGRPSDAELRRFAELAKAENMWLGDRQDNAAVGIELPSFR